MDHCLWCDKAFFQPISWEFVFGMQSISVVCAECEAKLDLIEGEICQCCGRPLSIFPEKYQQNGICNDCIKWRNDEKWADVLVKNRSIYHYNDYLQEILAKYKFRGDAAIVSGFKNRLLKLYKSEFSDYLVVPIPLSEKRHYERGFNQSILIAQLLGQPIHDILMRQSNEAKQSKKGRVERIAISTNIFARKSNAIIKEENYVIIDDIYTTGATVRQAAKILLDHGAMSVSSLTIARS